MTNETHIQAWQCGADLVVNHLEQQGVKQVFGIMALKLIGFLIHWKIPVFKRLWCATKRMQLSWLRPSAG